MRPLNNVLTWRLVVLLLVCAGLVACTGPVVPAPAVPTTPAPQATTMSATATEQPAPTTPPTASPTLRATPSPEASALPLEAIAQLLNASQDLEGLDALITSEFMLHPLPYPSQLLPGDQAVPNIRAYLGSAPQVTVTEDIPQGIDVTEWVSETADAVAYSTGWGINGTLTALLLFTDQGAEPLWSGLILSPNNFSPLTEVRVVPPPPGLTYQLENQIFAVSEEGSTAVFQETGEPADAYLPSPTNSHLLVLHRDSEMVNRLAQATLIEPTTGTQQPLEPPYLVALDSIGWLNEATLGMGVWLDEEDALGQTPGRPLTFDINSGEWTLLTDHHATISQVGDGRMVYSTNDEFIVWRETGATSYPLTAGGLPTLSYSEQQWILRTSSQFTLANEAEQTELLTYRAAHPQGSFIAQVAWSPDDRWVALRTAPTDLEMDGIWLYALDEEKMIFLGSGTTNPLWQDNQLVLFNALIEGEVVLHAYNVGTDVGTAGYMRVDVPAGSVPLHFVSAGE